MNKLRIYLTRFIEKIENNIPCVWQFDNNKIIYQRVIDCVNGGLIDFTSYNIINKTNVEQTLINDLDNYDLGPVQRSEDESWNDVILSVKEIAYSDYWSPSDVIITFKRYDESGKPTLKRFTFELDEYWDNCYDRTSSDSIDVKYDKNIPNDIEITKYDFLRGKATMRSKLEDIEYEVDFDELNSNDVESDEVTLPKDTFTRLANILR